MEEIFLIKGNKEYFQKIFEYSWNFLLEMANDVDLDENDLKKYFIIKKVDNMHQIFKRILESSQNTSRTKNVIKFWDKEREEKFEDVLCGYNHKEVLKKYDFENIDRKEYNEQKLYEAFCETFKLDINKNDTWRKFSKTVITAAKFLSRFKDVKLFDEYITSFENHEEITALAIKNELYNMGYALTCDFIKELGYTRYVKPDIHIKDFAKELKLCPYQDEVLIFKTIQNMADSLDNKKMPYDIDWTPYSVDKVFWLIGAGDFYKDDVKNNKDYKKKFINDIKKELSIKES